MQSHYIKKERERNTHTVNCLDEMCKYQYKIIIGTTE